MDVDDEQWGGLGNSKNRTASQLARAKEILDGNIANLEQNTIIAFTDGSALKNPGPCGAAAVIYTQGLSNAPTILEKPISTMGNSYVAELHAISLATAFALTFAADHNFSSLTIFSDCQSALKSIHNHKDSSIITSILRDISELFTLGIPVRGFWVCGHANLEPNELVDLHAKQAAAQSLASASHIKSSPSTIKSAVKSFILEKWQRNWNNNHSKMSQLHQKCSTNSYKSIGNRFGEIKRNRLILGHSRLKSNLKRIGIIDSEICSCGLDAETVEHIFYNCPLQAKEREAFVDNMEKIFLQFNVIPHQRLITLDTILGPNDQLHSPTRKAIDAAINNFLSSPNFKI